MIDLGTPLSGANYTLKRVFWFVWRWDVAHAGRHGLALGRRAAMRGARTFLRDRKEKLGLTTASKPAAGGKRAAKVWDPDGSDLGLSS